jgi:hypothetical protein
VPGRKRPRRTKARAVESTCGTRKHGAIVYVGGTLVAVVVAVLASLCGNCSWGETGPRGDGSREGCGAGDMTGAGRRYDGTGNVLAAAPDTNPLSYLSMYGFGFNRLLSIISTARVPG